MTRAFNAGPYAAVSNNTQSAESTHLSGAGLFADLPPASRHGPTNGIYTTAYTTDLGVFYSNGTAWVGLATAANTPFNPGAASLPSGVAAAVAAALGANVNTALVRLVQGMSLNGPMSVSMLGDSITVRNNGADLSSGAPAGAPSPATIAALYTSSNKAYSISSPLQIGAARSNYNWFPFETVFGASSATTTQIKDLVLPVLLAYPYGLPKACVVLGGTNDAGGSVAVSTVLANLLSIYTQLLAAGVIPIAATVPPRNDSTTDFVLRYNLGIVRLAAEIGIPCVDFYSGLVAASNGQYAAPGSASLSLDGVHPTPAAVAIMGYLLNQTITTWFPRSNRAIPQIWNDTNISYINNDPLFQAVTGTPNSTSSYPTGWTAPGTPAMSTIFTSAGTEIGVTGVHTMFSATAATTIGGVAPNYVGNAWQLKGDGTHNPFVQDPTHALTIAAGDRIAFRCRFKWIGDVAAGQVGAFTVGLMKSDFSAVLVGMQSNEAYGYGNATASIGNEAGYFAGDLYQEVTCPAAGTFRPTFALQNYTSNGSNTGDSAVIANMEIVNLTTGQIVTP